MKWLALLLPVSLFAQPANVSLSAPILGQQVLISWTDTVNPSGTTYNIYQVSGTCPIAAPIPGPPVLAGVTVKNAVLSAYNPGAYCFTVTAVNGGVESGQSNFATLTIPIGQFDNLGVGFGIIKTGAGVSPVTLSVDTAVMGILGVGNSVPASCSTANQVFFQAYQHPDGTLSSFTIWLCDGKTLTYKRLPLYKQGT